LILDSTNGRGFRAGLSSQRRWTIVGLLFTASFINYLDRATISFALPLVSGDLHLAPESKGLLLSSFFWSYALMQIPIGWCADHLNLRWLYAGAFALWSLAQGLTGLAGSLGVLIGFRILLGIGESIYLPGGTKIVSLLFARKDRGLPSGLFDFGTRTGLVFEGVLVPWLLDYGWRRTFLALGFAALIWLVPWFWVFPSRFRSTSADPGPPASPVPNIRDGLAGVEDRASPQPATGSPASPAFGLAGAGALSVRLTRALANRNLMGICLGFF